MTSLPTDRERSGKIFNLVYNHDSCDIDDIIKDISIHLEQVREEERLKVNEEWNFASPEIQELVKLNATRIERERCAGIAEDYKKNCGLSMSRQSTAEFIAKTIRESK